jgi:hypothetical protein
MYINTQNSNKYISIIVIKKNNNNTSQVLRHYTAHA